MTNGPNKLTLNENKRILNEGETFICSEDTSEDNTTRYWREQQARDKLQIAEETEQWVNEHTHKK
jgi:hypothetical protein